ncbi:hypothetical protein, conserved [Babesia ovata]|uniref:Uncharacterized protein n=1 Tax=Babesia ovata TaxID=189622 RepID=A0A2H6KDG9_9APIC|nr:uncharacterized protein BOVATA_025350 [Babesia ovata]GBE61042.1 hypothetical protein, conserved [Babesia ovata]
MVYFSLTDAPRNLKESIDWLMALRGADAETNLKALGSAVYDLLADKPVGFTEVPALENVKRISKEFLEQEELKNEPFVKGLLWRFNNRMKKNYYKYFRFVFHIDKSDYENVVRTRGTVPEKIAENLGKVVHGTETFLDDIKNPDKYRSAYSSEATWDNSCSAKPEACAVVFVGIAPMLCAGLRSLRKTSNNASATWSNRYAKKHFGEVMKAVGYKEPECRAKLSGSDVRKALSNVDIRVLEIIYDLAGFWAFY